MIVLHNHIYIKIGVQSNAGSDASRLIFSCKVTSWRFFDQNGRLHASHTVPRQSRQVEDTLTGTFIVSAMFAFSAVHANLFRQLPEAGGVNVQILGLRRFILFANKGRIHDSRPE